MRKINPDYFSDISNVLKSCLILSINKQSSVVYKDCDLSEYRVSIDTECFPLVVLIGGVAGSGKSTFIECCKTHMKGVYELSTIECCKMIVEHMANLEHPDDSYIVKCIEQKNETYRTLLNRIKTAWCKADDGPNTIVCQLIRQLINNNLLDTSVIFVNVREPEQIDHLKHRIESELGCVVVTLAVLRNHTTESMNTADKTTLDYCYDIYINNVMDLHELDVASAKFCAAVSKMNKVFDGL